MPNISKITLPDGVTYDLVATSSDTKVTQNNTNADEAYRVLLSKSGNNTTETGEVNKTTSIFYNPNKKALTVGSRMISTTIGTNSTSIGSENEASGNCAFAEGYQTQASGNYSHTEGYNTTASVGATHAEGSYTTASGSCSHAEGNNTTASGDYSHAEGNNTTASGSNSHAEGSYTTAQRKSQHVLGEYNVLDTGGTNTTTRGDYVEIVGNGTGISARSNARTLDWSGNQWIAGSYKSDALTASKILVSDANKNIASSSLAVSDLITTSNIGSQSVDNATKWNGKTDDSSTANHTDTWIPVYASGKVQHTERVIPTAVTHTGYNTNQGRLATLAFLSFWNGAYNANGSSNLAYCNKGAFGTVITKNADDVVQTYTDNTFYKAAHMVTFKGSNNALVGGGKGNYIWGISAWSDSRLKKNIRDSQVNALDIINKIQMREFDFKDEKFGVHKDIGYVAQELMNVIPDCVEEVELPDEDKEKYGIDSMYQVEDKHLIPYLVKAIQEQQRQIDDMQKQIDELKDTIKTLTV